MSKIFDAYKKQVGERRDLDTEIGRTGTVELFQPPARGQKTEFSRLASQILGLRRTDRGTIISFGSSTSGEGASFVSYNVARLLAREYGQKVVWIDANFLAPQSKLRGSAGPSLADLLREPESASDLAQSNNPLLLPAGRDLPEVKNLLTSRSYATLLNNLAQVWDLVFLDLPPMLVTTDTALMAAATDGFLLVIEQCNLKWEVIEHGLETLRSKNVRTFGAVINRRSFALPKVIYDRL